jgi:hypothetical protein
LCNGVMLWKKIIGYRALNLNVYLKKTHVKNMSTISPIIPLLGDIKGVCDTSQIASKRHAFP